MSSFIRQRLESRLSEGDVVYFVDNQGAGRDKPATKKGTVARTGIDSIDPNFPVVAVRTWAELDTEPPHDAQTVTHSMTDVFTPEEMMIARKNRIANLGPAAVPTDELLMEPDANERLSVALGRIAAIRHRR